MSPNTALTRRRIAATLVGLVVLTLVLSWLAWGRSPETRISKIDEAIVQVEQGIRSELADRMRDAAECRADSVELGIQVAKACFDANPALEGVRQHTLRSMNDRLEVLREERARVLASTPR